MAQTPLLRTSPAREADFERVALALKGTLFPRQNLLSFRSGDRFVLTTKKPTTAIASYRNSDQSHQ